MIHVEHAVLLGVARNCAARLQHGHGTPISSLHYFADLFAEVQQEVPPNYSTYTAQMVDTFDERMDEVHLKETGWEWTELGE